MKARFKIKLNQNELVALSSIVLGIFGSVGKDNPAMVPMYDLTTALSLRLLNMYRPQKSDYTLRLSSVDAWVLMQSLPLIMQQAGDSFKESLAERMHNELQRQFDHEVLVVNAILRHDTLL